ncbi:iron dicitrate transport regulator FecR [Caulobacter sp. CCUG 60055]|uniref:FecR family protein n=2 Tax=Pseudomonadota TaxID=1224 RepID=UPI001FA70516|nr:FecR domain-containing protein [Caulobacter sp. CCUG 60055]MBQ1542276.1 FecR domain-containing protein [Caulobacteraceae bacterium]MCI3180906.1 iron dicitrate transport regulator FecR [Caulobacter sp. CCUG 60055]
MKPTTPKDIERLDAPDVAAAAWFARLQADDVTAGERAAFDAWLQRSEVHADAWARVGGTWSSLDRIENDPSIEAMRRQALAAGAARRGGVDRRGFALAAASSAAAVIGAGLFGGAYLWRSRRGGERDEADTASPTFTTAVGQQASFRLADGSVVTLNTDSAVHVGRWTGERRLTLVRGQAFFKVAKDPERPFIVTADDTQVTAVGTAFDVRLDPSRLSVTLVEGRIRVAGPNARSGASQTVEMDAGSQLVAHRGADWRIAQIDAAKESSWLQGQLVFDGEPLATVAAEMNRFSTRKLRLADPALNATPVSGVFKTGQVDAFARALQSYGLARISASDDQSVDLVRP